MEHNENTRVKIPALVHLTRLGYKYLSLKEEKNNIDTDINIFKNIFCESINKINGTNYTLADIEKIINELKILLENDDLGKAFYKAIVNGIDGIKLIDFTHIDNNSFNVVTELTYISNVKPINEDEENKILIDTNYVTIKGTPEYNTNLDINTPTNRIITSLFTKERLLKILKYGIAYVERTDKNGIIRIEKHIMRYPQLFATLTIENKLNKGINKGIIWHTQGSGKTALTYFNVKYLTDYFAKKGKIAKFYFIVDRLDLLD